MAATVENKTFDATVWEVTPGTHEPEVITRAGMNTGTDVLSFIAVGGMLLTLSVINAGWIAVGTVGVIFPVLGTLGVGLALLAIHAVVSKRLALAGGLGFLAALAFTYVLLGAPTLSAFGDHNITQALGMTFMIWAIVGGLVALALLPRHFFMGVVLAITDVALWLAMGTYFAPNAVSANTVGYVALLGAVVAFLVGLVGILWPDGVRWRGGSLRIG